MCALKESGSRVIPDTSTIPDTMRALVLDGVGFDRLHIAQVPVPKPGPRQMLARVDAAGICTSLIKLVEQGPAHHYLHGWDVARYPIILGDEGSITLVQVGEELGERYHPGQRCVIQPAVDHPPINHLDRYRDRSRSIDKIGVGYTLPGHLAEYILVTEEVLAAECLIPLPDNTLPYAHAALAEPFACVVSAQDHHLHLAQPSPGAARGVIKGLKPGGVTVIAGAGAMGRMHVDLALSYQPRAIVVIDLIEERLGLVRQLFARRAETLGVALQVVDPATTDVQALVNQMTGGHGADDVIVAVGSRRAIETVQHYAGRGAVLNLFGGLKSGEDLVELDSGIIHYQEINVSGSSGGSPWDITRILELMAAGEVDAGKHISRIGDLDHALELLEMVKAQRIDGKAVVYPHRRSDKILTIPSWSVQDERTYLSAAGSSSWA